MYVACLYFAGAHCVAWGLEQGCVWGRWGPPREAHARVSWSVGVWRILHLDEVGGWGPPREVHARVCGSVGVKDTACRWSWRCSRMCTKHEDEALQEKRMLECVGVWVYDGYCMQIKLEVLPHAHITWGWGPPREAHARVCWSVGVWRTQQIGM